MNQVVLYALLPSKHSVSLFKKLSTITCYFTKTAASCSSVRLIYEKKKKKKNNQKEFIDSAPYELQNKVVDHFVKVKNWD